MLRPLFTISHIVNSGGSKDYETPLLHTPSEQLAHTTPTGLAVRGVAAIYNCHLAPTVPSIQHVDKISDFHCHYGEIVSACTTDQISYQVVSSMS